MVNKMFRFHRTQKLNPQEAQRAHHKILSDEEQFLNHLLAGNHFEKCSLFYSCIPWIGWIWKSKARVRTAVQGRTCLGGEGTRRFCWISHRKLYMSGMHWLLFGREKWESETSMEQGLVSQSFVFPFYLSL